MAETDAPFAEMISTLEGARLAVQADLESLLHSTPWDVSALAKLHKAVCSFASQADSVFVLMITRNVSERLMDQVEDLVDFFQDAKQRIASRLSQTQEQG